MIRRVVGIALALVLAWAGPAWAQATLVGQNATSCTGGATSCQSSAGIAVSAGDLLVGNLAVRQASTTLTVSASDATNGAWTCPAGANLFNGGISGQSAVCYFLSSAAATIQPTASVSGGTTNSMYWWFQVVRVSGTWALDQVNEAASASGGPYTHGSITTTGAGYITTVALQNATVTDETANASFTAGTSLSLREYWQYWLTSGAQTTDGVYTAVTSHVEVGAIASFVYTLSGGGACRGMLLGVGCDEH